jgi:hypothetical protein
MLESKSVKEEFLDRFTEELIASFKIDIEKRKREEREKARIKREVELEKLRKKFSEYGEKKENSVKIEKEEPKKVEPNTQAIEPPIITEEKKNLQEIKVNPVKIEKEEPKKDIQKEVPVKMEKSIEPSPSIKQKTPIKITTIPVPKKETPVQPGEIDFGKIVFLIKDPLVTYIECPGEDKSIVIKKMGATSKTQLTLKKEEIQKIIKSFSEVARIPLIEGMLNAKISNLEISAVVSEVANNSFIIKKSPIQNLLKPISQLQRPMMQIPTMPRVANIPKPQADSMPAIRPFMH